LFVAFVLVAAVACSSGDEQSGATVAPSTSVESTTTISAPRSGTQGCGIVHEGGEYEGSGSYEGVDQPYWIVVPEAYTGSVPAPLYIHLASGTGDHNVFMNGWRPQLDGLPGLMLMVNTATGQRGQPDTLMALVDQVAAEYCIDPQRIHVLGTSSSFDEAIELACEHSDRIASFVAALGGGWLGCVPDRPVPLLSFTGDWDRRETRKVVEAWAEINGCDPDPVVEALGSGVSRLAYQTCEADVLFYDIEGMGHKWPLHEAKGPASAYIAEYEEVDYLEEAIQFFAEHPLP
jgi:poly(3-hydroxybutyrate) depolymerase